MTSEEVERYNRHFGGSAGNMMRAKERIAELESDVARLRDEVRRLRPERSTEIRKDLFDN